MNKWRQAIKENILLIIISLIVIIILFVIFNESDLFPFALLIFLCGLFLGLNPWKRIL